MKRYLLKMSVLVAIMLAMAVQAAIAATPMITVAYVETKESIAKSYMLKYILEEKLGVKVNLVKTTVDEMWKGLAEGKYDATLSVTLPEQKAYYNKYAKKVEDLGPNWIDEKKTIHTIARSGLQKKRPALTTLVKQFCLCGGKLESAMNLVKENIISRADAKQWIKDNEEWVANMMGLCPDIDLDDWA
ncbi:MAG TPA: glycine betaine ABC transporter substrate-binding protein [Syntrophales bacterium]|nr:glycine betaine ABC transporter substrate-binding protein [Syntrophales bacterium]